MSVSPPGSIDLKIYEAAVRGRQQFREAYRLTRDENRRLRAALKAVRIKAIPAGAAVGLRREGWEARCIEVLDIIDDALDRDQQEHLIAPELTTDERTLHKKEG